MQYMNLFLPNSLKAILSENNRDAIIHRIFIEVSKTENMNLTTPLSVEMCFNCDDVYIAGTIVIFKNVVVLRDCEVLDSEQSYLRKYHEIKKLQRFSKN